MKKICKAMSLLLVVVAVVCVSSTSAFAFTKTFPNGTYVAGKDIPAGTYTIEPINGAEGLKYEIYNGSIEPSNLYEWMLLDQQRIISLKSGEQLRVGPEQLTGTVG